MFENKNYGAELLLDPLKAQAEALRIQEERLNGTLRIADANNPFCYLLEFGASLNTVCTSRYEDGYRALYPLRAQTMEDLYKHMSDYDYVNLFSKPAMTTIELYLNKDYLVSNALDENTLYKKVVIPRETVFTIGKFTFGLYYPIIIRITKLTGTILTSYDVSENNPLMSLSSNMVESTVSDNTMISSVEQEFSGLVMLALRFPVYQFARSYVQEDLVSQIGFGKKYKFNNKFYAARIYSIKGGIRSEMHQTLSPVMYDPTRPTAKLTVDTQNSVFKVDIPQIYFTNKQIGNKLGIEVFTCLGALDTDLSGISMDTNAINFNLKDKNVSPFAMVLGNSATLAVKLAQTKVTGGSDGYLFDELRDRVVNDNFYKTVPITPTDVQKYFSDNGFYVRKTYDGITDRVFTAYRTLLDEGESPLPTAMSSVYISKTTISDVSTIVQGDDESITILPTTIYKFNKDDCSSIPLPDTEKQRFKSFDKELLAQELNKQIHTVSPFHLRLDMAGRYPSAVSYNLRVPEVTRFDFAAENKSIASMMTGFAYKIMHLQEGVGGYDIYISVTKSGDIASVAEDQFLVWFYTNTREGLTPGVAATFVNKVGGNFVYKVHLETNYKIDDTHRLCVTNMSVQGFTDHYVSLDSVFYVTYFINRNVIPDAQQAGYDVVGGLPDDIVNEYVGLSKQNVQLHLGHPIDDVMRNAINVSYEPLGYMRYPEDSYLTYPEDVYATNEDGTLRIDIVDGKPITYIVHNEGDIVKDESDEPIYAHRKGDIIFDTAGQPIVTKERELVYRVDMMQIDARVIFSEHPDQADLSKKLPEVMENYFGTVREIAGQMLEQTRLYFSPTRSMGIAQYSIGDGVTLRDTLNMSFAAKYYVPTFVLNDKTIRQTIEDATIDELEKAIQTKIISMSTIFDAIKSKLSDYIYQIDVLGINGNVMLQSVVVLEDGAQPSIAKQLVVSSSNTLELKKMVNIQFVGYGV